MCLKCISLNPYISKQANLTASGMRYPGQPEELFSETAYPLNICLIPHWSLSEKAKLSNTKGEILIFVSPTKKISFITVCSQEKTIAETFHLACLWSPGLFCPVYTHTHTFTL